MSGPRRSSFAFFPWWAGAAGAIIRRPQLWAAAAGQVRALAPSRWWRRRPPLPLPPQGWLAFRMETAYGDPSARPSPEDVVTFLNWCRQEHRGGHYVR